MNKIKLYFSRLAAVTLVGFFFVVVAVCFPFFAVYYVATGVDLTAKLDEKFKSL